MLLKLQITFTILSALCVAALVPVGVFFGWIWLGVCGLCAVLFFMLMKLCKQSRYLRGEIPEEEETQPPQDGQA